MEIHCKVCIAYCIRELCALHQLLACKHMHAVNMTGLAHAGLRRYGYKLNILEFRHIGFKIVHYGVYLLAGFQLRLAEGDGVRRRLFAHMVPHNNTAVGVGQLKYEGALVGKREFHPAAPCGIHNYVMHMIGMQLMEFKPAYHKHTGNGLAEVVAFAAHCKGHARSGGNIAVAGAVYNYLCPYYAAPGFVLHNNARHLVAFKISAGKEGVKKNLASGAGDHVVQHLFHNLKVKGNVIIAAPAAALFYLVHYLGNYVLFVCKIKQRNNEACGPHAAQKTVALHKQGARAAAGSGNGGAYCAGHYNIILRGYRRIKSFFYILHKISP